MTQTDWIGTVGVTLLLIAFFLNLVDKIHNDSFLYLSLNLVGATIACLASILLHYWPFIILEACWTLVSAYGLITNFKTKAK
jgi:hypothetical protein